MSFNYLLDTTYTVSDHVSAAAFSTDGRWLAVGADDGTVRFYQPPDTKVKKAIRGLGSSASCVAFQEKKDAGLECWVAVGRSVLRYDTNDPKTICTAADASFRKEVGADEEDTLNQIALNASGTCLALTTDAGTVLVLDTKIGEVTKMRTAHTSIAYAAAFIPDRPSELISGGYDCAILHFDFRQNALLGRFEISPSPNLAPGISSLPPFIVSLAVSPSGVVAAGAADGRVWLGLGGEKRPSSSSGNSNTKKKRTRKWGGLSTEEGFETKVGEGMITGLVFASASASDRVVSCSVNGRVVEHELVRPSPGEQNPSSGGLREVRDWSSESCVKVDVLAYCETRECVALGGMQKDAGKGVVEVWSLGETLSEDVEEGGSQGLTVPQDEEKRGR